MPFSDKQIKDLQAKLDPSAVSQRSQSGRALSYIEGWWAIAEANRIFGFDAWSSETVEIRCVSERERSVGREAKPGWGVTYTAKVRITVDGVMREGVGAGHGIDVDLGLAHESAIKEAETDARKRGLMTFGNPFGLALYDKTKANVADDPPVRPAPQVEGVTTGAKLLSAQLAEGIAGGRKSSAAAKRDGDDKVIKADIAKLDAAGLFDWRENFDNYTAHLPVSWLDSIRNMLELREEELTGEARVADAEAELDEGFRGAVHSGGASGVARHNGHSEIHP
jgi:DNA recombination protein Rad52